jgi:phage repressor protein C with HTH and peptisase S24 domain
MESIYTYDDGGKESLHDRPMSLSARIAQARQHKGLSQQALADHIGVSRVAVTQWESAQTTPAAERLLELARLLDVRAEWLMTGRGAMDIEAEPGTPNGYVWVPTLARMGSGEPDSVVIEGPPVLLPASLVDGELAGTPADFLVSTMAGKLMEPTIPEGSTLLIDRRLRDASVPAVFALWDGSDLLVEWARRVPRSNPSRLRLAGEAGKLGAHDVVESDVTLIGRVVWFSRRL